MQHRIPLERGSGGRRHSSLAGSPLARTSAIIAASGGCACRRRSRTSISLSSTTLVILPMRPPVVTTVSPRRSDLDHLLMLLHAPLLRAQDQEIHDDEDEDERQQRHQHVVAAANPDLRIGGGNEHRSQASSVRRGRRNAIRRGAAKWRGTIAFAVALQCRRHVAGIPHPAAAGRLAGPRAPR